MPLSKLQSEILVCLAAHRGPRFSADIDIFRDREERVARAAEQDVAALQNAGMQVQWQRREATFYQALISHSGKITKL